MSPSALPLPVGKHAAIPGKVAYFFTSFPVLSETFLQREVRAMRELDMVPELFSIWQGGTSFEGLPIRRFSPWELLKLLWKLPWAIVCHPDVFCDLLTEMLNRSVPSLLNVAENLWGLAFAVVNACDFNTINYRRVHAVWSSMPAVSAWLIYRMKGVPYTMGAHAYDVFEDGGDWLLSLKLRDARLVHTTTEATRSRLLQLGARARSVLLVRRGLVELPPFKERPAHKRNIMHFLTVGRLVEKKGLEEQLQIYALLKQAGLHFEVRIAGEGPLARKLEVLVKKLGLTREVHFTGRQTFPEILRHLQWADVFLFTGKIAANGDRDGFPNAVAEAMAVGVPVVVSSVGGLPEVIEHGSNGLRLDNLNPREWVEQILRLQDPELCDKLRNNARQWVEKNFNGRDNAARLLAAQSAAVAPRRSRSSRNSGFISV